MPGHRNSARDPIAAGWMSVRASGAILRAERASPGRLTGIPKLTPGEPQKYHLPVGLQEDLGVVHQAMCTICDGGRVASSLVHDNACGSRTCFAGSLAGRPFEALAWHGCTLRNGPIDCVRDVTVKVSVP